MAIRPSELYETDFYSWTVHQAEALRLAGAQRLNTAAPVDWLNLAEEVLDMGKAEADRLESALRILLLHLLKWDHQPTSRSNSWQGSIVEHRRRAMKLLRKNPGLKPRLGTIFAEAYDDARAIAAAETGLPDTALPPTSPYSLEQALSTPDLSGS